jgi:two-component system LytT family sensor kinase
MHSQGMHHAWLILFSVVFASWLPWTLATPLVLKIGRRFSVARPRQVRTWLTHIAVCTAIALAYSAWTAALQVAFKPYADASSALFLPLLLDKFFDGLLASLVLYAAILTIGYAVDSKERVALHQTETARLNEQLSRAQLEALRRQIEPHLLFNTLNSVSGLVREGRNEAAVSMIAGLSDLFRRVLQDSSRQQVSLGEEVEFATKYLEIQRIRFADRLHYVVDVSDFLFSAQVPVLFLQPLVENAIVHGIAKRKKGGTIRISAVCDDGILTVSVDNDGPDLPDNSDIANSGIGLSNVRSRLRSIYGASSDLRAQNRQAGGVEVAVSLPFVVVASQEA